MTGFQRTHHDKEAVRPLRCPEQPLEQNLVLTLPDSRLVALEHAVDHARRVVGVESTGPVEPGVSNNPGPGTDGPIHFNSGGVIVGRVGEEPATGRIIPEAPPPDAAETCDRH